MSSLDLTLLYLLAAVLGVAACRVFKLPPMLGYLAVGVIIGAAFARRFTADGAKVVVTDIDFAVVQRVSDEIGTVGLAGDITEGATIKAVADLARRSYGEIDIWFSNAGYAGPRQPGELQDDNVWDLSWQLHVMAHVRAVREVAGEDVPLFVRVSATDWTPEGLQPDEVEQVAAWAHEAGADLIDTSTGGIQSGIPIPTGPGYQVQFATGIKHTAEVPVNAVGQITDPHQANEIIETGQADAVMLGRELMRDPHFALRASTALGYTLPYWPEQYERAQP